MLSKRISFIRGSQGRISFCCCYCPQETQPESLLESVGIPGCMCREPGMPCVCTRLIALGKETIFIPKHAVVQVKSTEITIAVMFRLLSLSFPLQRFACTLLLTWASSAACDALLGWSAQGRGICCRNGWSLSRLPGTLIHQSKLLAKVLLARGGAQQCSTGVKQELRVSHSLGIIPSLALDSFQSA